MATSYALDETPGAAEMIRLAFNPTCFFFLKKSHVGFQQDYTIYVTVLFLMLLISTLILFKLTWFD